MCARALFFLVLNLLGDWEGSYVSLYNTGLGYGTFHGTPGKKGSGKGGGGGRKIVLKVMVHGLYNFDRKIKYAPGR